MNKDERIQKALTFLQANGYRLGFTSPKRGVDLLLFHDDAPNTVVFVAVTPLDGKSFPMQPFAKTAKRMRRFRSLVTGSRLWFKEVGWTSNARYDSVVVADNGTIDHIENAGRKGLR